jgi:hypothetical protein
MFWIGGAVIPRVLLDQPGRMLISRDLNKTVFDCFPVLKSGPVLDQIFHEFNGNSFKCADQLATLFFGCPVGDHGNLLDLFDETFICDIIFITSIEPGEG